MAAKFKAKNGPAILELEEVVIGSQCTPIAVRLREETAPGSGVFADMDLTGKTLQCDVKDNLKNDINADAQFTVVPRTPLTSGWVDLYMDGTVTATLLQKTYYGSLKVWPTANPELGDTVLVIVMPVKYEATR